MQAGDFRAILTGLAYNDNTLKAHIQQIQQYMKFCSQLGLPHARDASAAAWVLHASEVLYLKKATVKAKLAAFKWAHATLWDRGEASTAVGSVLYWTQRAIARRADDREPKLAVGREGLTHMIAGGGAGMGGSGGRSCQRGGCSRIKDSYDAPRQLRCLGKILSLAERRTGRGLWSSRSR